MSICIYISIRINKNLLVVALKLKPYYIKLDKRGGTSLEYKFPNNVEFLARYPVTKKVK